MVQHINGFAAEQLFWQSCKEAKIPQQPLTTQELVKALQSSSLGKKRLNSILPHLERQYEIRDWSNVPANDLLDKLGLDFLINFRGWLLGIDITTNPKAIQKKISKLEWLSPLWQSLQIDKVAVAYVTNIVNKSDLIQKLREIRQGSFYIEL